MKIARRMTAHRQIGPLFEGQSIVGLGEVQLLERFIERRDEPAFAALVARHGPMVLGVCRRLLVDPHDVEDAFQATFLILVRRAGSLRDPARLAPWLFGVARKVATRARTDLARRRAREIVGLANYQAVPEVEVADPARELGRALVEEIDRLPASLREPVLLCCVEGLTYDDAASRLRSTAPAIRGRLARARVRLKERLIRRGFAPAVGVSGLLLAANPVSAVVPSRLLMSTIQVAQGGMVPLGAKILAEGVIRTMILTKSKFLAAAVVACGIAGSGMGVYAQRDESSPKEIRGEGERLDKVEKKLDRVLQALEGRSSQPMTPTVPAPMTPAMPTPPPVPTAAIIEAKVRSTLDQLTKGLGKVEGITSEVFVIQEDGKRVTLGPGGMTVTRTADEPDRLEVLEKKLRELEAKIVQLEKKLNERPAPGGGGFN